MAKVAIEEEDVKKTMASLEAFIDPKKYGSFMIEQFFEEHRDMRLWKVRLDHRGQDYLISHKERMLVVLDNVGASVTKKLRDSMMTYSADKSQ